MAFTMEDGSRTQRGTDVILHISEEEKEFLEEYRVREVLQALLRLYGHACVF